MIYDAVRFHNGAGRNGHCATMAPCTPEANTPSQPQPLDLAELVRLREEDIAKLDVAEIQLACAAGLPGSEKIDVPAHVQSLNHYARCARKTTEEMSHLFEKRPQDFRNSLAVFRCMVLTAVLQDDLGVAYVRNIHHEDPDYCSNSQTSFVHGIFQGGGGTCSSLPVLFASIGRKLGYPIRLVTTYDHMFARWEGPNESFNIECATEGFDSPADSFYRNWPVEIIAETEQEYRYLQSLTPREELAAFLMLRACCCEYHKRYREAAEAAIWATSLNPKNAVHARSAVALLQAWETRLRLRMPQRFPAIRLRARTRKFADMIPWKVEECFMLFKTWEELLEDPITQKWCLELRWCPIGWPAGVPTSIHVDYNG